MIINNEKYIAYWDHTKWLVISSFFFIFPSFYSLLHSLYFHSALLLLTTLISANYWRKATFSWRRNMDLIFSKVSGWVAIPIKYASTNCF